MAQKSKDMSFLEMPTINKDFEVWDEPFFQANKTRPDSNGARLVLPDDSWHDMLKMDTSSSLPSWYIYYPAYSFFRVVKLYYADTGFIYQKAISISSGNVWVGYWYEFDREGNFVGMFNDDDRCGFKFNDVVSFCLRRKIPLTMGRDILTKNVERYNTDIYRDFDENGKCTWEIEWQVAPGKKQTILLDGDTGEILKIAESRFIL